MLALRVTEDEDEDEVFDEEGLEIIPAVFFGPSSRKRSLAEALFVRVVMVSSSANVLYS